jgi:hypothetical protein
MWGTAMALWCVRLCNMLQYVLYSLYTLGLVSHTRGPQRVCLSAVVQCWLASSGHLTALNCSLQVTRRRAFPVTKHIGGTMERESLQKVALTVRPGGQRALGCVLKD